MSFKQFYTKNKAVVWVAAGVAAIVLFSSFRKKQVTLAGSSSIGGENTGSSSGSSGSSAGTSADPRAAYFPLKYGERSGKKGFYIKALQRWLNYRNGTDATFTKLAVDGIFGPKTLAAWQAVWEHYDGTTAGREVNLLRYEQANMMIFEK